MVVLLRQAELSNKSESKAGAHSAIGQVVKQCMAEGGQLHPFRSVVLRLTLSDETRIASALDAVASSFAGQVSIGSYPVRPQASVGGHAMHSGRL